MTRMIRTAALATALLLTTALAAQANALNDHWKRPKLDTVTTQGINESTSPGDPFYPPVNAGGTTARKTSGNYDFTCHVTLAADGTLTFTFTNVGLTTVPAYSVVTINTPHGPMTIEVSPQYDPGETATVVFSPDWYDTTNYGEWGSEYDCTVTVTKPKVADVPK